MILQTAWSYIWHPTTNKLSHIKNPILNWWFSNPFPYKKVNCVIVQCHPCPFWPPALPLNLTYTVAVLLQLLSVDLTYRVSSQYKFQVSCPFSAELVIPQNGLMTETFYYILQHAAFMVMSHQLCIVLYRMNKQITVEHNKVFIIPL
jgi:hypothetical protein